MGDSAITPPAATALPSPGAEYKDATHPLEVVRQSLDNWSDAELNALSVGIKRARESCQARKAEAYSGDDLYELARLCSFGQDWNDANTAATRYIDSKAEPWRAQAYALSINAMVRLNGVDLAVQTAETMLRVLPYDAEVAYAVRYLKDYLEQSGNSQAVTLAEAEHASIIQALSVGTALKATHGDAVMSLGLLYDSAMELAFFHKFAGQDTYASEAAADCDDSLKKVLIAPDEMRRIESVRLQFTTVGMSLPQFTVLKALESPAAKAAIEGDLGEGTVLVLFPDWCAQCRGMMKTMTQFARVNAGTPLHAYGLMFTEDGDKTGGAERAALYKGLAGTQTFLVPAETAKAIGALDFPTAVAVDNRGVVRFIGMIPTDAFNGGGYMEKVFMRMAVGEGQELEREQGSLESNDTPSKQSSAQD
jgi:thiol-disulfide isomerase/thioredoxin